MQYDKGHFKSFDGLALYHQSWTCHAPRARVVFIHGYAEHSGRYAHFGKRLNASNIDLYTFDQRGKGRSEGRRAWVKHFDRYLRDVDDFLKQCVPPDTPVFIMGNSLGGLMAVLYCLKYKPVIHGLVTSAAALKISEDISPFLQRIAGILSATVPKLRLVQLNTDHLSRDPEAVKAYQSDPLIYHGKTYARTGGEILKATREVHAIYPNFHWPLLVLHGGADRITDPEGSRRFYREASSEDKTLRIFDGLYHELLFEPEKDDIVDTIVEWINQRL